MHAIRYEVAPTLEESTWKLIVLPFVHLAGGTTSGHEVWISVAYDNPDRLPPIKSCPVKLQMHAVLDATGDASVALTASLYRCMDSLAPGQILHAICQAPDTLPDILRWCSLEGHEIVALQRESGAILYWIRKQGHV